MGYSGFGGIEVIHRKRPRTFLVSVTCILITASIAGGIIYSQGMLEAAEKHTLRRQINELQNELKIMTDKFNAVSKENSSIAELRIKYSNLLAQVTALRAASEANSRKIIEWRAYEAVHALKNKDMTKLAALAHPEKGIRFTPYPYVSVENNLVFTPDKIKNLLTDTTKYNWGFFDGSGEVMELTFEEYYNRFIFDKDFTTAPEVGYNRTIGEGNSLNNSFEVYPDSIIVEYHFPGFDPEYSGMDWRSLRLVFEQKDYSWYIVGIIHGQWTI